MGDECRKCKRWQKEQYWNGESSSSSNKQRFFKIMLGDFESQLEIPKKFVREFMGELSEEVNLRGPSGNIWTTKLVEKESKVFFEHGWDIFVEDHNLYESDFLVFEYSGNSCFDVLIFDATCCEREGSYYAVRNGFSEAGIKHCCSLREAESIQSSHGAQSSEKIRVPINAQGSVESSLPMENDVQEDDETRCSGEQNWLNRGIRIKYLVSSRRDVTREEKNAALQKAKDWSSGLTAGIASKRKSHSKLPACLIVMKPSHVNHGFSMTIPKWFAELYISKEHQSMELKVESGKKESWGVQVNKWRNQCLVTKGWVEFVVDNNLEEGDVCVLSLPAANKSNKRTRTEKISALDVSIFRVVDHIVKLKVL